jgi:predicted glycogen debranching enzyme
MRMPTINLNREALSQLESALRKEWLVTNGLGGYASSTVLGVNTRKYHGLLVGAFHPPGDRIVCLTKLDDELEVGKNVFPLGANEFQNGLFPKGYLLLKDFSVSPFPTYVYEAQNVEVQKTVFMLREKNATVALYRIRNRSSVDVEFRVFPLVDWRRFHSVTNRWKDIVDVVFRHDKREVQIAVRNPQSSLILRVVDGHYRFAEKWVEGLLFREEKARGESCLSDCLQPGHFEASVKANRNHDLAIIAVADQSSDEAKNAMNEMPISTYDVESLYEDEAQRSERFLTKFYERYKEIAEMDWLSWLVAATDSFIVKGFNAEQKSVIAGYYWFEAWGRDTFVSLPGLLLMTGRYEDAKKVFLSFKPYFKQGLIPNFIPESAGEPAYNSVDATLWFVNAVLQYLKYSGDFGFVQEHLWGMLKAIVENLVKGTMFNIHMDGDGLLAHGPQLTWMDAAVNGQPITPRSGKAVEIQALWYNALKAVELLARKFGETNEAEKCATLAEKARKSFADKFWDQEKDCLLDVVGEGWRDGSLRPNQVFAVSLDFTMLDNAKNENVVELLQRELSTPFGLRTLARSDPRYVGVYAGDRGSRDTAYHNGTVWPWLQGPFVTAFLKINGYMQFRREYAWGNFLSLLMTRQVYEAGLGSLNEILDGEPPYLPRGCIAQAWSVAEPLRAYVEDIMMIRPKYEREVSESAIGHLP